MKLCWDNIENIRLSRNGNFWDVVRKHTYYLKVCKACGEEFFGRKENKFCCNSCAQSGKNNPMHSKTGKNHPMYGRTGKNSPWYGKKHSDETKEKMSHTQKGKKPSDEAREKMSRVHKGKKISDETKEKMSRAHKGVKHPNYGKTGENSPCWKGGYDSIPLYDTYAHQIDWCEEVRRSPDDSNVLEVGCTYCGKWYIPSRSSVTSRILALKGETEGECRLYCSDGCKKACPIYHKSADQLMLEDAIRAGRLQWLELNREVQPELRKMVLERDEYTCQKCGTQDKSLHCHHILPVATDPIESADVDNCITYCVDCHKQAHDQDGCRYSDLQTEIC